jgi:metal-responsive CopG/Arc/MetJ family transcriptional regulator
LAKNEQWSVTLDAYHRFVVEKLEGVFGTSRSDVVEQMVRSWVSDHSDQVKQAEASITHWRKHQLKRR